MIRLNLTREWGQGQKISKSQKEANQSKLLKQTSIYRKSIDLFEKNASKAFLTWFSLFECVGYENINGEHYTFCASFVLRKRTCKNMFRLIGTFQNVLNWIKNSWEHLRTFWKCSNSQDIISKCTGSKNILDKSSTG